MDIMRRAAAGELSEVIGESTIKMDREQRILGLRQAAEAAEKNISAATASSLTLTSVESMHSSIRIAIGFHSNSACSSTPRGRGP